MQLSIKKQQLYNSYNGFKIQITTFLYHVFSGQVDIDIF